MRTNLHDDSDLLFILLDSTEGDKTAIALEQVICCGKIGVATWRRVMYPSECVRG